MFGEGFDPARGKSVASENHRIAVLKCPVTCVIKHDPQGTFPNAVFSEEACCDLAAVIFAVFIASTPQRQTRRQHGEAVKLLASLWSEDAWKTHDTGIFRVLLCCRPSELGSFAERV